MFKRRTLSELRTTVGPGVQGPRSRVHKWSSARNNAVLSAVYSRSCLLSFNVGKVSICIILELLGWIYLALVEIRVFHYSIRNQMEINFYFITLQILSLFYCHQDSTFCHQQVNVSTRANQSLLNFQSLNLRATQNVFLTEKVWNNFLLQLPIFDSG